jgi:membrane-associated phospholipid phosphatase
MRRVTRVAFIVLAPAVLSAQRVRPSDTTDAQKTLFTGRDAAIAAGFAGLTVAMFPLDKRLALNLQSSSAERNQTVRDVALDFEVFTDPGSLVIGAGLYAVGRFAHLQDVEDLGLHGTEAVGLAGGLVLGIRAFAGRTRPYVTNDSNPHDFHFLKGISDRTYQSFPSGHSAAAFAAAAAVTSESQRWWPQGTWIVAPVLYGGAALVAISRMYDNQHWASDVALGAGIGTFSGLKVVRYNHSHPGNIIDRMLLATIVAPDGYGGVRVGWSVEQ